MAATTLLALHAQSPALIGYWHNWNDASAPYIPLDQIDPRYNVVEVAFAEPVAGSTYVVEFVPEFEVPADFIAQVAAQKALGKKVVISLGGANATIQLNSDQERDWFIGHLMYLFSVYGFNGLDLDLEGSSVAISGGTIAAPVDSTVIRLIHAVKEVMAQYHALTGEKLFLTMAPETAYVQGGQSAFGGIWGAYLPIVDALRDSLDILQVQLYNSGSMYGIDGGIYTQGTADFIVSQTEAVIQGFNTIGGFFDGLAPEKVAVALPACASAAGGGYADTTTVRMAMEYLLGDGPQPGAYTLAQTGGYPGLRGMMTWSINWDAVSACDGVYSYAENFERIFGEVSTDVEELPRGTIALSPNPVQNTLRFGSPVHGAITIRDLSGRIVQREEGTGMRSVVDVGTLRPGIYLLDIKGSFPQRFVKE
ncbi:MAG: T9SS type A sorting domain-containing protein [Flavobacteriales bacterium]|nr:T9SS type A sorting domain-containing protein [Flavobacteriales bacterium]